jgi:hypothetical protein
LKKEEMYTQETPVINHTETKRWNIEAQPNKDEFLNYRNSLPTSSRPSLSPVPVSMDLVDIRPEEETLSKRIILLL